MKNFGLIVVAGMLFLLQGCAGFHANNIEKVNADQLRTSSANKVKVYSRWDFKTDSANAQVNAVNVATYKKRFDEVLTAANCCVIVAAPGEADLVVDGVGYDENSKAAIIPALITGFSLYTIPSWVTINFHVTVNAQKGSVKRNYDVKDSMTMVQWLPMALAFPFANPFPMEKELGDNAIRNLILKMKQDVLL
ncbi:MAG: hypothetical protein HGA71_11980 [Azonexaceae bacterium]|nr:hypothetical protein [Azonexaceae bacterium]